jgi:hypothetical protein
MADHLHLTQKDYFQLRTSRKDVPAHSILLLSEELQLDPETLSFGRLDYTALQIHQSGKPNYLRERYSEGAFCQRRICIPILDYSDLHISPSLTDLLLKKFQVRRSVFEQADETINLRFLMDAFDFYLQMRHPAKTCFQMGAHFSAVNQNTEIGKALHSLRTVHADYDYFITQLAESLDNNYSYRLLKLDHASGTLEIQPKEHAIQFFQSPLIGNQNICLMKAGLMSGIPVFLNLPFASTIETHCIHRDDPVCRFNVNFEYASAVHKKKSKSSDRSLNP